MGEVPRGQALRRDGATPGDDIWVSGVLGAAALGLAHLKGTVALPEDARIYCLAALHQPHPRIALGLSLRGIARSAIDVSDGLLADLGHILERSQVGAEVNLESLPIVDDHVEKEVAQRNALSGGDDYELCFTAPVAKRSMIEAISVRLHLPLTRIGSINTGQGCTVRGSDGSVMKIGKGGYDHFA